MAYAATLFSAILLAAMLIPGTPISMGMTEYVLFFIWLAAGAILYVCYTRRSVPNKVEITQLEDKGVHQA